MVYGLTSLKAELWAAESPNGNKITTGSSYSRLTRILSTSEVTVEASGIDVTAVEDPETHYAAGRAEVSDTYTVEFLATNETVAEWRALAGKQVCFLEKVEGLSDQTFIIATVPNKIPKPPLENGAAYSASIGLTVNNYIGLDTAVTGLSEVTAITLSNDTLSLTVDGAERLTATTTPSGREVTWSTTDASVAEVTSGGIVVGVAEGTATIKATNGGVSASCTVTVTSA